MAEVPKWLSLTTLNKEAQLDKHPLKYFERLEPKAVARPDPQPDPLASDEPDWDAIEAKVEKETRESMQEDTKLPSPKDSSQPKTTGDVASKAGTTEPTFFEVARELLKKDKESEANGLTLLRAPFPDNQISQLPKGTKEQNGCPPSEKRSCSVCGGWHHPKIRHLWEPLALTPE
jgi:hypothetical protein